MLHPQGSGSTSPAPSFARLRNELKDKITLQVLWQRTDDRGPALRQLLNDEKEDVKRLFDRAASEAGRDQGGSGKSLTKRLHLKDREEDKEISRACILATLIFLDVTPTDTIWTKFVKRLGSEHPPQDFFDRKLPFDASKMREIFGSDGKHTSSFERLQWLFLGSFSSSFRSELDALRAELHRRLVVCQIPKDEDDSKSTLVPSKDPRDTFMPEGRVQAFVNEKESQIKSLYVESEVALEEPDSPYKRHEVRRQAEQERDAFFESVRKVPKVFATLLLINTSPTSKIWRSLIQQCLLPDRDRLEGMKLPCTPVALQRFLDCESSECSSFCENQYTFCPIDIELQERKLIRLHHYGPSFRLPLWEKRKIGSGAYGRVYEVKFSPDGPARAMKYISLREEDGEPNEWKLLELLRDQNVEHKRILKALAGVHVSNAMLIFFERCDNDLYSYMTADAPDGPDRYEWEDLLVSMLDIVEAQVLLHNGLARDHHIQVVCYHKDIKPENILVRRDKDAEGRLRLFLSDLGIGSIIEQQYGRGGRLLYPESGSHLSGTRVSLKAQKTRNELGDLCENIAPEARIDGRVNAKTDVWGSGTVFADFIVWLLDGAGKDGLEGFRQARRGPSSDVEGTGRDQTFFQIRTRENQVVLKQGVTDWYENRKKATVGDTKKHWLYTECWWLIKNWMLVCDEKDRKSMEDVYDRLKTILEQLKANNFTHIPIPPISDGGRSSLEVGASGAPHAITHTRGRSSLSTARSIVGSPGSVFSADNANAVRHSESEESDSPPTGGHHASRTARPARHARSASGGAHAESATSPRPPLLQQQQQQQEDATTPGDIRAGLAVQQPSSSWDQRRVTPDNYLPQNTCHATLRAPTAIEEAVRRETDRKASKLIRDTGHKVDFTRIDRTILHLASEKGMVETVRLLLLDDRTEVDALDGDQNTALSRAIAARQEATACKLITEHGARIDGTDRMLRTPLHLAVQFGLQDLAVILISRQPGILVNKRDMYGRTPLHTCALTSGKKARGLAEILLHNGASLTRKDTDGNTAEVFITKEVSNLEDRYSIMEAIRKCKAARAALRA